MSDKWAKDAAETRAKVAEYEKRQGIVKDIKKDAKAKKQMKRGGRK